MAMDSFINADKLIKMLKEEIEDLSKQGNKTIKERAMLLLVISYIKDLKNQEEEKTDG